MTTEQILHAEALRREAVKFAEWLLAYIDKNYSGISKALVVMGPDKFISTAELYDKFKSENK